MRAGRRHRAGPAHGMRREGPQGRFPCGLFLRFEAVPRARGTVRRLFSFTGPRRG